MERHFEKTLDDLKACLSQMCEEVKSALASAERCLMERDPRLSDDVFQREERIDQHENELQEMVLDFIARNQPVAVDLRFILSLQDAVVDLERIGDHATNIAQSAVSLTALRTPPDLLVLPEMFGLANQMLETSVASFLGRDAALARATIALDDRVDELNREVARQVIRAVKDDRQLIETGLELIRISRNLERVSDLAANISEDALFLIEGRSAKHQAGA